MSVDELMSTIRLALILLYTDPAYFVKAYAIEPVYMCCKRYRSLLVEVISTTRVVINDDGITVYKISTEIPTDTPG